MERILWINACMRGREASRTWGLCRDFLERCRVARPGAEVTERDLTRGDMPLMTAELAQERDRLAKTGAESPLLLPARELAAADLVVVGAPYWDLAFPAALKVYLEWVCTLGITFAYSEAGEQVGLCRAGKLIYITTAGGPVEGQNYGYDYLRAVADMVGIPDTACVAAQGLDIRGADVPGILAGAWRELATLAEEIWA